MTNSAASQSPAPVAERLTLPGAAVGLLFVSVILLPIGGLTLLGTAGRSFFENAPTQATVGVLILLVGAGAMAGSLVLFGVRAIAQEHLDAVRRLSVGTHRSSPEGLG